MLSPAQHARSASVAPRPPCPWPWRRLPARRAAALPPLPAQVPLAGAARAARPGLRPRPVPVPLAPSRAALGQPSSRPGLLPYPGRPCGLRTERGAIGWLTPAPGSLFFRRGKAAPPGSGGVGNAGVPRLAGPPPGSTPAGRRDFETCGRPSSRGPLLEGRRGEAWFRGGGCIGARCSREAAGGRLAALPPPGPTPSEPRRRRRGRRGRKWPLAGCGRAGWLANPHSLSTY